MEVVFRGSHRLWQHRQNPIASQKLRRSLLALGVVRRARDAVTYQ